MKKTTYHYATTMAQTNPQVKGAVYAIKPEDGHDDWVISSTNAWPWGSNVLIVWTWMRHETVETP